MALTPKQRRQLRALGHRSRPVVSIGNSGLTDAVYSELESSLQHHELLKVKIQCGDRAERNRIIESICDKSHAELVQRIGHVALIYRPRVEDPGIHLKPQENSD